MANSQHDIPNKTEIIADFCRFFFENNPNAKGVKRDTKLSAEELSTKWNIFCLPKAIPNEIEETKITESLDRSRSFFCPQDLLPTIYFNKFSERIEDGASIAPLDVDIIAEIIAPKNKI